MKGLALILCLLFSAVSFAQVPISVSVKTASYTIPAGKWARVTVNLEGAATFTIGGTLALRGTTNPVIGVSGNLYRSGGTPSSIASTSIGQLFSASTNPGSSTTSVAAVFDENTHNTVLVSVLHLPAGTIINGTGTWRAVVELYER